MSFVHEMLTAIEARDRAPLTAEPAPQALPKVSPRAQQTAQSQSAGLFVLDMPNEIVSDFYALKEHVRFANRRANINALAIADSSQGEGSSTIATYLAFLMSGGISEKLNRHDGSPSFAATSLTAIADSDQVYAAGLAPAGQSATTADVFRGWDNAIDSRYVQTETSDCVLLVDANMHKPSIHRYFGIGVENGLAEIIERNKDWQRFTRAVRDSRLHVLTAGRTKMNPVELLGSDRFRELVQEWKRTYRFVIFDSPAVLNYIDSLSLASAVDGVVLVVKAGQTRWDSAQKAKQKLASAQANVLGVTLNRRKMDIPDGLYRRLI